MHYLTAFSLHFTNPAPHGPVEQLLQLPHGPAGGGAALADRQQQPREDRHPGVQPLHQGHLLPAQDTHQPPAQRPDQLQGRVFVTSEMLYWLS